MEPGTHFLNEWNGLLKDAGSPYRYYLTADGNVGYSLGGVDPERRSQETDLATGGARDSV